VLLSEDNNDLYWYLPCYTVIGQILDVSCMPGARFFAVCTMDLLNYMQVACVCWLGNECNLWLKLVKLSAAVYAAKGIIQSAITARHAMRPFATCCCCGCYKRLHCLCAQASQKLVPVSSHSAHPCSVRGWRAFSGGGMSGHLSDYSWKCTCDKTQTTFAVVAVCAT